ncbi:uncharacterized protein LOC131806756 isoform X1 [Musca domestica]|uniref:Uncharacterized protein LOC131806756 isoform X1 n=2 Tax=Musca domestica TaxID=7370 RepID=A0ABM3VNM0_MUSDO|nr:uncharacterized protein LOC131806756 isoform X1 [Musca domestica]XP_058987399.1 uncharacterized protein LOC131806756 isoform X1 [Musca domestica]
MAAYLPNQDCRLDDSSRSPNSNARPTARSANRPIRPSSTSPERRQRSRSDARPRQRQERPSYWQYSCGLCQDDHALSACERFRRQTPFQRYETVERRGYCRNCLARSHLAPDCPSLTGCRRCNDRHHTLLHGASQLDEVSLNIEAVTTPAFAWDLVFVPTAMVRITAEGMEGFSMLRAIISQSATMSKISYAAFRRLGLQSRNYKGERFTTFTVSPRRTNSTWRLKVNALIIEDLPRRIYSDPILEDPTRCFTSYALADPDPRGNSPIDVELGADTYSAIRKDGCTAAGILNWATCLLGQSRTCRGTKDRGSLWYIRNEYLHLSFGAQKMFIILLLICPTLLVGYLPAAA